MHVLTLFSVGTAATDGRELPAAVPVRQPTRVQRRIHEGNTYLSEQSHRLKNKAASVHSLVSMARLDLDCNASESESELHWQFP